MCSRKDKYGLNMQAMCDHHLRFTWIDIRWPGISSDYMAWVTSKLCDTLEKNPLSILLDGITIIGDAAYVKSHYMATPFKSTAGDESKCAYNFYHSQLRVSIERAFGVLVHQWAILRTPMNIPLYKVPSVVMCLCRLHNFCIESSLSNREEEDKLQGIVEGDARNLHRVVRNARKRDRNNSEVVSLNDGRPDGILDGGEHFDDCPSRVQRRRDPTDTPMDDMFASVIAQGLLRPMVPD